MIFLNKESGGLYPGAYYINRPSILLENGGPVDFLVMFCLADVVTPRGVHRQIPG